MEQEKMLEACELERNGTYPFTCRRSFIRLVGSIFLGQLAWCLLYKQDKINNLTQYPTCWCTCSCTVTQKVLPISFVKKETGSVTKLPYCFLGLTKLALISAIMIKSHVLSLKELYSKTMHFALYFVACFSIVLLWLSSAKQIHF